MPPFPFRWNPTSFTSMKCITSMDDALVFSEFSDNSSFDTCFRLIIWSSTFYA